MAWLTALLTLPFRGVTELIRRFLALSLPARIAWTVGIIQFLLCVFTLLLVVAAGGKLAFQAWWTPGKGMLLVLLLVLVPLFVYFAMRLWLHEEVSRWRDIEQAWREALAEVDRLQIDLHNAPLFLVLGTDGRDDERSLMQMAPVPFVVVGAPPGSAPLHVYAGHDAVFICISSIGQCCAVAAAGRRPTASKPVEASGRETSAPTASRGTGLAAPERAEAYDRLTALCERIVATRQPLAPVNGIAVVASLPLDADAAGQATAFGAAVAEDLQQITTAFGLRAPVTLAFAMSTGFAGFKDFGGLLSAADRAKAVGQSVPPGSPLSAEDVDAVAINTGGRLADLGGAFLAEPVAIDRPEVNRAILRLNCRIRSGGVEVMARFLRRMIDFVADGLPPLLAGCYVVFLSERGEAGVFGRGFFERMLAVQGELDWTTGRLRRDRQYRVISILLMVAIGTSLVAAVGMIAWRLFV